MESQIYKIEQLERVKSVIFYRLFFQRHFYVLLDSDAGLSIFLSETKQLIFLLVRERNRKKREQILTQ